MKCNHKNKKVVKRNDEWICEKCFNEEYDSYIKREINIICDCVQYHSNESGTIEETVCDYCKDKSDEIPF